MSRDRVYWFAALIALFNLSATLLNCLSLFLRHPSGDEAILENASYETVQRPAPITNITGSPGSSVQLQTDESIASTKISSSNFM